MNISRGIAKSDLVKIFNKLDIQPTSLIIKELCPAEVTETRSCVEELIEDNTFLD